jgi:class 3 adenylate cyclase
MEAPPVQYTTTSDGVSIAWAKFGRGPALLYCGPTPFTHVRELFTVNENYYLALARSFRVITFDARGVGMSERDVADVSLATLLMDAGAVIEAARLDRFVLYSDQGLLALSTALQLASRLAERVTHLVLSSPFQNMGELADTPMGRLSPLLLAEADWPVYVETLIRVLGGWDAADSVWVDPLARAAAGWSDASVGRQYIRLLDTIDVGPLLGDVRHATLALRAEPGPISARVCQRFAARIPGAQFRQHADSDYEQFAALIREFAGLPAPSSAEEATTASGTAVVLFTDIVDSTTLTEQLGDAAFRDASRGLDAGLRAAIRDAGGAAIEGKLLGDGVLATFPSAAQAIDGARRCLALSAASELGLHIGLHAGDVIREDNNVYGGAVNIASRICGLSAPGEILVSDVVRGMARSSAGVEFEDRGEQEMKGVGEPVRVYAVRPQAG